MAAPKRVVLTVPIYNEAGLIADCTRRLNSLKQRWPHSTQLIMAEDGSTDTTRKVLRSLGSEYPDVSIMSDPVKRGRGFALRRAWSTIDADIYAFTDADLPGGTDAVRNVVAAVACGADAVTASRYALGAETVRPPLRNFVSMMYNRLVRIMFSERIHDHQCGIKAFSRRAASLIIRESKEDSWFWDTEALVLLTRHGFDVKEIPVRWIERKYAHTSIRRLFSDMWLHGLGLLRLFVTVHGSSTRERGITSVERSYPVLSVSESVTREPSPAAVYLGKAEARPRLEVGTQDMTMVSR